MDPKPEQKKEEKVSTSNILRDEKLLAKMTHKQLKGIFREIVKENTHKEGHVPGLDIAEATVALTVLSNTKTKENPFAKLSHYLR